MRTLQTRKKIGTDVVTITGPVVSPFQASTTITVNASDSLDTFTRVWAIWIDKTPGSYQGGGRYSTAPDFSESHSQGAAMQVSAPLTPGTHQIAFVVTQTGGSAYGTYSGTMTIAGQGVNFSGVDFAHPFVTSVTIPSGPPPPPTTTPPTTIPPKVLPPKVLGLQLWQLGLIGLVAVVTLVGLFVALTPRRR